MSDGRHPRMELPDLWGRRRGGETPVDGVAADRAAPVTARDVDAGSYLQTFLVTAVAAILVTRLYLELAGFPRVGGGGLHIAHLLWGGLLMLAAQVLLLAAVGKRLKRTAAVVGGAGFGVEAQVLP